MTAPDPRLEAVAKAIYESDATREGGDWLSWERLDKYLDRARAAEDAIRAFDEQRGTGEWPLHEEPKPFAPLMEEGTHGEAARSPAASPASADPPWLGRCVTDIHNDLFPRSARFAIEQIARAVLRFAAEQGPSEAEIEAAARSFYDLINGFKAYDELTDLAKTEWREKTTEVLLAAAKVRAGG